MSERELSEDLVQKFAAGKLFRIVTVAQSGIHLCAYLAAFVKLISIEGGGYYNSGVLLFIGVTMVSMPLFLITKGLIERSLKISKRRRFTGYCFHLFVSIWSLFVIKISYYT
jgi:hypothetical protein